MSTPIVRAASTKPAAAIVLPEAVGWRKRKRRAAPGSSPTKASSSSSSSSSGSAAGVRGGLLLVVLLRLVRGLFREDAVAVLRLVLVRADQLREHPGQRVDL